MQYLLFGELAHVDEIVVTEDLAKEISIGEVGLEALNVAAQLYGLLARWRHGSTNPIQNLFGCH